MRFNNIGVKSKILCEIGVIPMLLSTYLQKICRIFAGLDS